MAYPNFTCRIHHRPRPQRPHRISLTERIRYRYIWVINFGLIACAGVIPLALICGPVRGIPFYWQLIDCSFGVVGFIPLWICRNYILEYERLLLAA